MRMVMVVVVPVCGVVGVRAVRVARGAGMAVVRRVYAGHGGTVGGVFEPCKHSENNFSSIELACNPKRT